MSFWGWAASACAGALAAMMITAVFVRLVGRRAVQVALGRFLNRLEEDPYHENVWELVTGTRRVGPQTILENELRSASGMPVLRPFGRVRPFHGFDGLMFDPAQLWRLPAPEDAEVDTTVVIGSRAPRPLRLAIPILVSGMGYGFALSREARLALARGAARAGTATNTGQGPLLPEERREARFLVLQIPRATWNRDEATLRQADMIEVQFGQGALAGTGERVPARRFDPHLRRALGLAGDDGYVALASRQPGIRDAADLRRFITELREASGGVPVGVKLAASNHLERDLAIAAQAGSDFVTVDGAEGGTHGAPPTLADDFGLPTFLAVCRAARFLAGIPEHQRPTLIVSGGLFTPGQFLKAIALGADAVAIGTAALFALGHGQVARALPWEPPLQIVWYGSPVARRLDVERAARSLHRFLASATGEMALATRALGKTSLSEVGHEDLFALDAWVAQVAGVRTAWPGEGSAGTETMAGWQPALEQVMVDATTLHASLQHVWERLQNAAVSRRP
jgi:glutamate synthase domain-containing protein 2